MGRVKHRRIHEKPSGPLELDPANAKLKVTTYEDLADSEDDFAIARDKLLLEDTAHEKRKRKWQEDDMQLSDEEVLGPSSESSEDESMSGIEVQPASKKRKKGKKDGSREGLSDDSEDEELSQWGTSKRDYYNADPIETEQDAIDEEKEARRLQKKKLESMEDADYMLDEDDWMNQKSAEHSESEDGKGAPRRRIKTSKLPPVKITAETSTEEKIRILRARYPEFEPLAADFTRLYPLLDGLGSSASAATIALQKICTQNNKIRHSGALQDRPLAAAIKYQTLMAYLGTLSMYFAILSSPAEEQVSGPDATLAIDPETVRRHPIMQSLVETRNAWLEAAMLVVPTAPDLVQELEHAASLLPMKVLKGSKKAKRSRLVAIDGVEASLESKKRLSRQSKRQRKVESAILSDKLKKKAELAVRLAKIDEDMAALSQPVSISESRTRPSTMTKNIGKDSDYGEEMYLDPADAAEKAQNRKSLRFYTSQIAQRQGKRERAGRGAGGDDDVPYKERMTERRNQLNREAEARGREQADQLGVEDDEEDEPSKPDKPKGQKADSDEEYYDLVASRSANKASSKFAAAIERQNQMNPTNLSSSYAEDGAVVGKDGKRKLTYAIEKNKGLAPRRKKDVRNPRVKKRRKFEEKQKKLGSVKPVWKGGEAHGGYGGEMTGIKRDLVRSVKL